MSADDFDQYPTAGTVLDPIVTALNQCGAVTEGTLGGVMRSLELEKDDVHYIACYCHEESEVMPMKDVAERLEQFAANT
jgi:hypothetical protein